MTITFAKATLAGVAGVMALAGAVSVPSFAVAQPAAGTYDNRGGYYYDPCRRDTTTRSTTGGIIGALAGAAIGSNLAAHHGGRTGGAALGGLAGAALGANIGKSTAACQSNGQQRQGYYDNSQRYYGSNSYDSGYYAGDGGGYYDRSRYDDRADDRYSYSDRYPVAADQRADANGCTLAESPIHMPDGRIQKRFVRVCPDANGRYQVVD